MRHLLVGLCIFVVLISGSTDQTEINQNKPSKVDSLRIFYPRNFFSNDESRSWRNPAVFSKPQSTSRRSYFAYSRAQDQEDIWLYENWWFGFKDGVIMESGALDGKIYSTSHMFEKYAGWTTINVG
jgi:hypothetical protein